MMMPVDEVISTRTRIEPKMLDKNAHIPGYKGHCPKIDQVVGQRFSESSKLSYLMHKEEQHSSDNISTNNNNDNTLINPNKNYTSNYTNNLTSNLTSNYTNNYNTNNTTNNTNKYSNTINGHLNMNLPSYNNYNRYTKNMISGYTGHIPNQASGFGKTFTETSNMRLMEHYRNIETDKAIDRMREREIQTDTIGKPQFRLQDVSLQMKEYMQARSFNDESQDIKGIQPIGGYQGHVPRKALLEGSVGTVDEEATRNALKTFQRQTDDYASTLSIYRKKQPITCHCK